MLNWLSVGYVVSYSEGFHDFVGLVRNYLRSYNMFSNLSMLTMEVDATKMRMLVSET